MPESKKSNRPEQRVIESLWLTYYNDSLYARGVISEEARNRMRLRIKNRATAREH